MTYDQPHLVEAPSKHPKGAKKEEYGLFGETWFTWFKT